MPAEQVTQQSRKGSTVSHHTTAPPHMPAEQVTQQSRQGSTLRHHTTAPEQSNLPPALTGHPVKTDLHPNPKNANIFSIRSAQPMRDQNQAEQMAPQQGLKQKSPACVYVHRNRRHSGTIHDQVYSARINRLIRQPWCSLTHDERVMLLKYNYSAADWITGEASTVEETSCAQYNCIQLPRRTSQGTGNCDSHGRQSGSALQDPPRPAEELIANPDDIFTIVTTPAGRTLILSPEDMNMLRAQG